jgi:intraflagellar transport protein 81
MLKKNRAEKLQKQKQEQNQLIMQCGHRMHRLQQQLKDMKQAILGMTPEAFVSTTRGRGSRSMITWFETSLPKEVEGKRKALKEIQTVVNEPAMGQNDLATIQQQIKATTAELNQLIEKRMMSKEGAEDKQAVFRNQAAIIGRKKETAAEKLFALREEFNRLQSENAEKLQMIQQASGGEAPILRGEDFTKYANKLRGMNVEYKSKASRIIYTESRSWSVG